MKAKKCVCPNCGREMSNIRFQEDAECHGLTVKCNKCGQIVEIKITKSDKK